MSSEQSHRTPAPPRFLMGTLLIWWGIVTGHVFIGTAAGIIIEIPFFTAFRWELEDRDFIRISDITSLLVVATVVLSYINTENIKFFREFVVWIPIALFPVISAQLYSTSDRIVIGTAFGRKKTGEYHRHRPMDLRWYYLFIVLFSAAGMKNLTWWHLSVFLIFVLVILYAVRNRTWSRKGTLLLLFTVLLFTVGIMVTHIITGRFLRRFIYRYYMARYEEQHRNAGMVTDTSMGRSGRISLSDAVVMRVRGIDDRMKTFYLREGVYNRLSSSRWYASDRNFSNILPGTDDDHLFYPDVSGPFDTMTLYRDFIDGASGLLVIPDGTVRVRHLNAAGVGMNHLGTVRIREGAGFLQYRVFFTVKNTHIGPPTAEDLNIPEAERDTVSRVADEIGIRGMPPTDASAVLRKFFSQYRYSLDRPDIGDTTAPVSRFLTEATAGHCEYFASAAVLLLREAGIPARYVTGYLVSEYSDFTDSHIVREQDAHAWVLVHDAAAETWVRLEVTPVQLFSSQQDSVGIAAFVTDFFSGLAFRYRLFRQQKSEDMNTWLITAVLALSGFLLLKVYIRKRLSRDSDGSVAGGISQIFSRDDSPFRSVADFLQKQGVPPRNRHETYASWTEMVVSRGFVSDPAALRSLAGLHEQYRFADCGGNFDIEAFKRSVAAWIGCERSSGDV